MSWPLRIATLSKGVLPPPGFLFVVDDSGAYLVDASGAFVITEA